MQVRCVLVMKTSVALLVSVAALAGAGVVTAEAQAPPAEAVTAAAAEVPAARSDDSTAHRALLDRYCVTCHNERMVNGRGRAASPLVGQLRAVGLTLDTLDLAEVGGHADRWRRWFASCAAGSCRRLAGRGPRRTSWSRS